MAYIPQFRGRDFIPIVGLGYHRETIDPIVGENSDRPMSLTQAVKEGLFMIYQAEATIATAALLVLGPLGIEKLLN